MLELALRVGTASTLPADEAGHDGAGTPCSYGIEARSTNVFEFKPSDFIATDGGAFTGCYGLITSDLRMYAITVIQNRVIGGHVASSDAKISAITLARLLR